MSTEEFDISQSMAAELTGTTGMDDHGGNAPDDVLDAVAEQETMLAERDVPVNSDLDDTREAAEQRDIEQEQSQQRGKKVPLAALHEERQKRQALELQLAAYQQQMQQLQAQQQAAQQAQLQAQQEAEIPPFSEDPEGHVEAVKRQFKQEIENLKNGGQQPQHQAQQFEAMQQQLHLQAAEVAPHIVDAEKRFAETHTDYPAAFDHVQTNVDATLRAMYPQATEAEFQMVRNAALVEFSRGALAAGKNPAELVYAKAQQLGFKPARQAPRREPPTSLSSLAGSARAPDERGAVTASDISSMSEKEFDAFWAQMKGGGSQGPAF